MIIITFLALFGGHPIRVRVRVRVLMVMARQGDEIGMGGRVGQPEP